MVATARDRAHFAVLAESVHEDEEARMVDALATPPGERMLLGLQLAAGWPWTGAHLAELDAQADSQMELARRRVALGLHRSPRR